MDEVEHVWQLLLPWQAIHSIPNAILVPLGIVKQDMINEYDKIIPKWRSMHDMSFNVMKATYQSVNHRVICEELTPCRYGTAILRQYPFHCLSPPTTPNLINPTDKDRLQGCLQMSTL
jgi:hypothetical protein